MALARFGTRRKPLTTDAGGIRSDFSYLPQDQIYLDSACQTLRPQPVIDAMTAYFHEYNSCGDRASYAWGRRVAEGVADAREGVIAALDLSPRRYTCAFTLNTTYGLNLLLQQLPVARFSRVITTRAEHNAVFLSTMTYARRTGIERLVVLRRSDGTIDLDGVDLTDALLVVSAMDNVTGTFTRNLQEIATDVRRRGGAVIVDAAQAAPHALSRLRDLPVDALCFSAHKMYGPALGVVVATNELLASLELAFVGGGQVESVGRDEFTLRPELHTRLEPGLQAAGEILAFGAALEWLRTRMADIEATEEALGIRLFEGLEKIPRLCPINTAPSAVVSVLPERVDAHRLAVFLSKAGVSVRSGHFCANNWLENELKVPPLVRFSIGAHTTEADVDRAVEITGRMLRGL